MAGSPQGLRAPAQGCVTSLAGEAQLCPWPPDSGLSGHPAPRRSGWTLPPSDPQKCLWGDPISHAVVTPSPAQRTLSAEPSSRRMWRESLQENLGPRVEDCSGQRGGVETRGSSSSLVPSGAAPRTPGCCPGLKVLRARRSPLCVLSPGRLFLGLKLVLRPLRARSPRGHCADPSPGQRMAQVRCEGGHLAESPQPRLSICRGRGGHCRSQRKRPKGRKGGGEGGPASLPQGSGVTHGSQTTSLLETSPSASQNLRSNKEPNTAGVLSCVHRPPMDCWPGLLCPWESPGTKAGVGCHALLQGIVPTQGSNPHLLRLLHHRRALHHRATRKPHGRRLCRYGGRCLQGQVHLPPLPT